MPTSLSSDLDLTVYVSNINDYQPQFLVDDVTLNFTENKPVGAEIRILPKTIDRDELEFDGPLAPICYFIIGGDGFEVFYVHPVEHTLSTRKKLDREEKANYTIIVKATEDCNHPPRNQSFFDSSDDTQLKVFINIVDVNDNAPKFIHRIFTGGVSTATTFGTKFMQVKVN